MKRILCAALGFSLFATTAALAGEGYITQSVNLRAGPDSGYPSVARLRAGTSIQIEGCVDDWSWCEVNNGYERGWVAANYIQEEYEGRRVYVPEYGVRIGIPIVSFAFGAYWNDHYRNRSWYGNRERWSHVRPRYQHFDSRDHGQRNSHPDSHHDSRESPSHSHGDTHAGRATDFSAGEHSSRRPAPAMTQTMHHSAGNAHAPQHPVAAEVRSQKIRADNGRSNATASRSPIVKREAVAQHHAAQPRRVAELKPMPSRAESKKSSDKHDHGKDKNKDKDHH